MEELALDKGRKKSPLSVQTQPQVVILVNLTSTEQVRKETQASATVPRGKS